MASSYEDPSVTVFGEYSAHDRLTVASFVWPTPNTKETYTIAPGDGLSLEFDRHLPMRLAGIALYDDAPEDSAELIERLAGQGVCEAILQAPTVGQFVLNTTLQLKNRLVLAHIQANSPSTPPPVRRAAQVMIQANRTLAENAKRAATLRQTTSASGVVSSNLPPAA